MDGTGNPMAVTNRGHRDSAPAIRTQPQCSHVIYAPIRSKSATPNPSELSSRGSPESCHACVSEDGLTLGGSLFILGQLSEHVKERGSREVPQTSGNPELGFCPAPSSSGRGANSACDCRAQRFRGRPVPQYQSGTAPQPNQGRSMNRPRSTSVVDSVVNGWAWRLGG